MTSDEATELIAEIARLGARLPIPDASWHAYVAELRGMTADLQAAVAAIRVLPGADAELLRQIAEEGDGADGPGAGPALADARRRLRSVPVPAGEHPFLDEILPTLEGAEAVLAALAAVPGGDAAFAAARAPGAP
jgi:hypothetical protein